MLTQKILEGIASFFVRQPSGVRAVRLDTAVLHIVARQNEIAFDCLGDERGPRLTLSEEGAEAAANVAEHAIHCGLLTARLQSPP